MEIRARVLKVEQERRLRAIEDEERQRAFKERMKTRNPDAWRRSPPCRSSDCEEGACDHARARRRKSPRPRGEYLPVRMRKLSMDIHPDTSEMMHPAAQAYGRMVGTSSPEPTEDVGDQNGDTPSVAVREVQFGIWDSSDRLTHVVPQDSGVKSKLPPSRFALWAASQIVGKNLDDRVPKPDMPSFVQTSDGNGSAAVDDTGRGSADTSLPSR